MTTRFNKIIANSIVVQGTLTIAVGATSGTTILLATDSGKIYDIAGGAQTITLPRATTGLTLRFVISANLTGAVNITCRTGDIYKGALFLIEESSLPYLTSKIASTTDDNLIISATSTTGSFIELVCITNNVWIVTGTIYTTSTYSSFT